MIWPQLPGAPLDICNRALGTGSEGQSSGPPLLRLSREARQLCEETKVDNNPIKLLMGSFACYPEVPDGVWVTPGVVERLDQSLSHPAAGALKGGL